MILYMNKRLLCNSDCKFTVFHQQLVAPLNSLLTEKRNYSDIVQKKRKINVLSAFEE